MRVDVVREEIMQNKIDSFLETPKHKSVLSIIREPKKRNAAHHLAQAFGWIGPGFACLILGIITGKTAYYMAAFIIMLVFTTIHILVHWDFIKTMWEITEVLEKILKEEESQQQPSSEPPSSVRTG